MTARFLPPREIAYVRDGLQLPEEVIKHNSPVLKAFRDIAEIIYQDRDNLGVERRDPCGRVIRPALPQILMHRAPREGQVAYVRRRRDYMNGLLSVLGTQLTTLDFHDLSLREPDHELAKSEPNLSVRRLAERSAQSVATVDRALEWERRVGLITYTRQQRVKKFEGSKAAFRRHSASRFGLLGPQLARLLNKAHDKALAERKAERAEAKAANAAFEKAVAEIDRSLIPPAPPPAEPDPPSAGRVKGQPLPATCDRIAHEHEGDPTWGYAEVLAEARRIEALQPPDADDSS